MTSEATTPEAPEASSSHIVVVGASLAGVRAAETLRREGFTGRISLIGEESHYPPVDRPPLSKAVLAHDAERPLDRVKVGAELEVDLLLGWRAVALDVAARTVTLDDGRVLNYDGAVIATGARARHLPGHETTPNVHVLRTADDATRLRGQLRPDLRVAVIGAGVLGCEIAATCRKLGMDVSLIDIAPEPMLRVVGPDLAPTFAKLQIEHGVQMLMGRAVLGLVGEPMVTGVQLDQDEIVPADLIVVAIGAVPDTDWLTGSGLEIADGVRCDEFCFALGSDRTVVAAGDVARWQHDGLGELRVEHWTNAVSQGQAAASNLLVAMNGEGELKPYVALPYFWSDQYDWKIQVVGVIGSDIEVVEGDLGTRQFVVTYHTDGKLVGALCVNWPARIPKWRMQILAAAKEG